MSMLKIPAMALQPSLWETLPKELLHLVFARLPVARIGQLRVLCKEWKRNVDCKDSEFNLEVFDAIAHLNMFALLPMSYLSRFGHIYDVQADQWHVYEIDAVIKKVQLADGADGGLLCCISERERCHNKPGLFIVMNPFTKQKTQLPPLMCMGAEKTNTLVTVVRMIKLIMDKKAKEYKVFIVGSIANGGGGFFAQVYDSHTKQWIVPEATQGYIIGWDYFNIDCKFVTFPILCVYNCAHGSLQQFNETDIAPGLEVQPGCCVLLEDHLFVLHKDAAQGPVDLLEDGASVLQKCCISKFHLPEKTTTWVKLRVHSCGPCKCFSYSQHSITSRLWGCNGSLLVYGAGSECAWLYKLSSCEWRKLPAFVQLLHLHKMCEISWSAIA